MKSRGFTLIELLFAMTVGFLALSIALGLYATLMKGAFRAEGTGTNWNLELLERLRRDIAGASLVSLSCYSGTDGAEPPGVSLLSAEQPGRDGGGTLSRFGRPIWQKKVYYTLDGVEVVRWEETLDKPSDGPPFRIANPPSIIPAGVSKDVVGVGVLAVGKRLEKSSGDGAAGYQVVDDSSSPGGFQVQFVRRKSDGSSELSSVNPTDWTKDNALSSQQTGLVQVSLTFAETFQDTGLTAQVLSFRVKPRN